MLNLDFKLESTPFSPPSGLVTASFNGLHLKSNFFAVIKPPQAAVLFIMNLKSMMAYLTARLLSQVFMGNLAAAPYAAGLCTQESGLNAADKASARRLVCAHIPLVTVTGTFTLRRVSEIGTLSQ